MMEIELRLSTMQDLAKILPLVRAFHELEQTPNTEQDRETAVRTLLASTGVGGIWLIYHGRDLAGYIALCRGFSIEFTGYDAFVDEFYLTPGFRGRGIGKRVLELIKDEARALDVQALHLEVARDNARAQRLYIDAGFAPRDKYLLMSLSLRDQRAEGVSG